MTKGRLEAFSDGVMAVIITIMVLEIKAPHDDATFAALRGIAGHLVAYVVSFVYVGIYWNNHHHLMHASKQIDGRVMWANLHLLFWLSLIPATTAWAGGHPTASLPAAIYGVVLFFSGLSWLILQRTLIRVNGDASELAVAVGRDLKGKASALLYASGIGLSFVRPWIGQVIFAGVALLWIVPDRRIEAKLAERETS